MLCVCSVRIVCVSVRLCVCCVCVSMGSDDNAVDPCVVLCGLNFCRFGSNDVGQCGLPACHDVPTPTQIALPVGRVSSASCGTYFTALVAEDGRVVVVRLHLCVFVSIPCVDVCTFVALCVISPQFA